MTRRAYGLGLATIAADETVLDTWFPAPRLSTADAGEAGGDDNHAVVDSEQRETLGRLAAVDALRGVRHEVVEVSIDLDEAPASVPDAYLRLHLLSWRLVRPNELNLDALFGVLNTVVWTSAGPCAVANFEQVRAQARAAGRPITVFGIDKFPRMVDYVVPDGVRIADADRVRLGAHLAPGTTVMHEGFVNFNAGTLGESMVEGRIAQGVVVESGADVGGGASIMGTLSGGGRQRVRIGPRSLLGANAGLGISLGADCVVEAGLYVTAGAKVSLVGFADAPDGTVVKAATLSGRDGVLFRRNSVTGTLEAVAREGVGIALNTALHQN